MKKLILAVLIALPVGLTSCKKDATFSFINDWCWTTVQADDNGSYETVARLSVKEGYNCIYTETGRTSHEYTGSWTKVDDNNIRCTVKDDAGNCLNMNFCKNGNALTCTNNNHEFCNADGSCAGTHGQHHGGQGSGSGNGNGHHGGSHH